MEPKKTYRKLKGWLRQNFYNQFYARINWKIHAQLGEPVYWRFCDQIYAGSERTFDQQRLKLQDQLRKELNDE